MDGGVSTAPAGAVVVYTAITGHYDSLKPQPEDTTGAEFVAFVETPGPSGTWQTRRVHDGFADPVRNARIHKILSHRYFPHAPYSLWIDGSVTLLPSCAIEQLIDVYLADCDIAVFRHPERTCVYQEAEVCLRWGLDDSARILHQVARYTREGYPANAGLVESGVVLRRHTPAVEAFNEAWWDEIVQNSKRDQLSFPFLAGKMGLRYATFPGTLDDNPLFRLARHAAPFSDRASRLFRHEIKPRIYGGVFGVRAGFISLRNRGIRRRPAPLAHAGIVVDAATDDSLRPATPVAVARALPARNPERRRLVGIGPVRHDPSWGWVGFDIARELTRYFDIVVFDRWIDPPNCDVMLAVKEPPPAGVVDIIRKRGSKLIYCPVDGVIDRDHLTRQAVIFRVCDMVLVHSERLLPLVTQYCANTHFVEHHARYVTPPPATFRASGYVLWVGGYQDVPYLLRWIDQHPFPFELRILAEVGSYHARAATRLLAAEIGVKLTRLGEGRYPGVSLIPWTERRQEESMRECRAALDVHAIGRFGECYKAPISAQQMIASGIPFAVNPESYSAEYFRRRGFDLASPSDTQRWFSREYWEMTQEQGQRLRAKLSLEAVGKTYRELIDTL